MINFLKEWKSQIGEMEITQTAQASSYTETLTILTGFRDNQRVYHCTASSIPFADMEKLADDGFRMEVARRDLAALAKELRAAGEFAEKALAVEHEQVVRREVLHDEAMGRHTP